MVRMVMRDVETGDRLPQCSRMANDLSRKGKRVLRIDHEELRGKLDDVRGDEPTVFWSCVCMDWNRTVCDRPYSLHDHIPPAFAGWGRCHNPADFVQR